MMDETGSLDSSVESPPRATSRTIAEYETIPTRRFSSPPTRTCGASRSEVTPAPSTRARGHSCTGESPLCPWSIPCVSAARRWPAVPRRFDASIAASESRAQREPVRRVATRCATTPKNRSISVELAPALRSPSYAKGISSSSKSRSAATVRPSNQWSCASRPSRAAAMKLPCAASKLMRRVTSRSRPIAPRMRPSQSAAFATSSSIVGPLGRMRFSIRKCGRPSVIP